MTATDEVAVVICENNQDIVVGVNVKAQKPGILKTAFIVNEENLRKLDLILLQVDTSKKYEVKYTDNLTVKTDDLNELFRQLSVTKGSIRHMTASTASSNGVAVLVELDTGFAPIVYAIAGSETEVPYLESRVLEWANEIKPWYSWIACLNTPLLFALILFIFSFAWTIVLFISILESTKSLSLTLSYYGSSQINIGLVVNAIVFLFLWLGIAYLFSSPQRYLFPKALFVFGMGLTRQRQLVRIRAIIAGIFLILIIPFLVNVFSGLFMRP